MTKTANKAAIRSLPKLRASLLWFKRQIVHELKRRAEDVTSPKLRAVYAQKARSVAKTDLADLRQAYLDARIAEIRASRRFELSQIVPGIVWLSAC